MKRIIDEIQLWNTPIIGAYLLWKFTEGYTDEHKYGDSPDVIMCFIVTGILSNYDSWKPINNHRKSLQSYVMSFEKEKELDVLLSFHSKLFEKKEYTLNSIDIAITYGLIYWDIETNKIYSLNRKSKNDMLIDQQIISLGKKAKILGKWFAQNSLEEILTCLKVVL